MGTVHTARSWFKTDIWKKVIFQNVALKQSFCLYEIGEAFDI